MENELLIEGDTLKGPSDYGEHVLIVPDGVKRIEAKAFYWNGRIQTVILPEGLEYIGESAFARIAGLARIFIPKSVKMIERDAFAQCYWFEAYCEGTVGKEWREGYVTETVREEVVTPEDDAFNFHRSGGGFTSHVWEHEVERWISWNPERRPVHENVSREEFLKLF